MPASGDYGVLVPAISATEIYFVLNAVPKLQSRQQRNRWISQAKSHAARASHKSRQLPKVWSDPIPRLSTSTERSGKASQPPSPRLERCCRERSTPRSGDQENTATHRILEYIDIPPNTEHRKSSGAIDILTGHWQWTGGGTRSDPFAVIPGLTHASGSDAFAFDWFCQYVSLGVASICQPFGASNLYGRWLLEQMALHSDVFHAIMAATHGGLAALGGSQALHLSQRLKHMGLSMQELQLRLAASDSWQDDDAVLTMVYLALLEEATGSPDSSTIHRQQVRNLIAGRGSVQALRTSSGIRATIEHSPPEFHPNSPPSISGYSRLCEYPTLPVNYDFLSELKVPLGFRDLACTGILSIQTIQCIINIAGRSTFGPDTPRKQLEEHLSSEFKDFREACPALTLPDDSDGQPPLEKLVFLALVRYCLNSANTERPASRCYTHNLALDLKQQLIPEHRHATILTDTMQQKQGIPSQTSPNSLNQLEREAWKWIWLMAIDTWSLSDFELSNAGKVLLVDLLNRFEEMRELTKSEVKELGTRWFWTSNVSGVLERYIYGPDRREILDLQALLARHRVAWNTLTTEVDVTTWPKAKNCQHCCQSEIVVAGWSMKGDVAASAAPLTLSAPG